MKLAYLGPPGTFSEEAGYKWLKKNELSAELVPFVFIPEVLSSVEKAEVDKGIVPVENSIEGTVGIVLDGLTKSSRMHVVGEIVMPIQHVLAGRFGKNEGNLREIKYVYSHPQALNQCRSFLEEILPHSELRQTQSTAEAANLVANYEDSSAAAICSMFAAEKFGLAVMKKDIQDYLNNKTRFFVIGRAPLNPEEVEDEGKSSFAFSLPEDKPGGLYSILKEFAETGVNLTKIESRPGKKELGHYIFYLDSEGYIWEEPLASVLRNIKSKTAFFKVLGTYPKAD